jgi:YVTN family beta-propeller protein
VTTPPSNSDAANPKAGPQDLLESWKAIADHLKRDVRTVRRWEQTEGLPVHRHQHVKGGSVYAYKSELEAWRNQRSHPPTVEEAVEVATPAPPPPTPLDPPKSSQRPWPVMAAIALVIGVSIFVGVTRLIRVAKVLVPSEPAGSRRMAIRGRVLAKATAERAPLETIRVGTSPAAVVFSPDGEEAYVANGKSNDVSVIRVAANTRIGTIPAGKFPQYLAISPDGSRVFVANHFGNVTVIDTHSGTASALATDGPMMSLALSPDGRTLYLAQVTGGLRTISLVDGRRATVPAPAIPSFLAFTPDGARLYINYQAGGAGGRRGHDAIDVWDVGASRIVGNIKELPNVGGPIAVSPDAQQVWANGLDACSSQQYDHAGCPDAAGPVFNVIRTSDNKAVHKFTLPEGYRIAFLPDSSRAIIGGYTLQVIDTTTFDVLESGLLMGNGDVTVSPDGRRAYLLQPTENSVAVLDLSADSCADPPSGLVGWWSGDGTANDLRGLNHGQTEGGAGFAPGHIGQAFLLDSNRAAVNFGRLSSLGVGEHSEFTVSAWLKFPPPPGLDDVGIFQKVGVHEGVSNGWRLLRRSETGRLEFHVEPCTQSGYPHCLASLQSREQISWGAWVHVAVTVTSGKIELFVNGSRDDQAPLPESSRLGQAPADFRIFGNVPGTVPSKKPVKYLVDELQWYNRALDPAEVRMLYAAGSDGVCYGRRDR